MKEKHNETLPTAPLALQTTPQAKGMLADITADTLSKYLYTFDSNERKRWKSLRRTTRLSP